MTLSTPGKQFLHLPLVNPFIVVAPTGVLEAQTADGARGKGELSDCAIQETEIKKKRSLNYLDSLSPDYSGLEWKSIYSQDYQPQKGVFAGLYTEPIRPSPLFPQEDRFNQ